MKCYKYPMRAAISGALALLFCFGTARSAGPSWQETLDRAERSFNEGRNEEAAAAAQSALTDAEKNLRPAAPEMGLILSRLSRFSIAAGAVERFPEMEKRLTSFEPKTFDVWLALAMLLREEAKWSGAEQAIERALSLRPGDPTAMYQLASIDDDTGRFEDEARVLKEAIEAHPQEYGLYSRLAQTYIRLGRSKDAKDTFARAKRIAGHAADAYIEEGYFYLHSDEPVQAKVEFQGAIDVDTASPFGYHHMGSYLTSEKQYAEAEANFRQALEKLKANPASLPEDMLHTIFWLGSAIEAQGRYPEAEAIFLDGLARARPGGASADRRQDILHGLALAYVRQGDLARAEATYRRAVAECAVPLNCRFSYAAEALIDLGRFYSSRGRKAEAEAAAEKAARACGTIPIGNGRFAALRDLAVPYRRALRRSRQQGRSRLCRAHADAADDAVRSRSGLGGEGLGRIGRGQGAGSKGRNALPHGDLGPRAITTIGTTRPTCSTNWQRNAQARRKDRRLRAELPKRAPAP